MMFSYILLETKTMKKESIQGTKYSFLLQLEFIVVIWLGSAYHHLQHLPKGIRWSCGHFLGCFRSVHKASVKICFIWCSIPQTISSSISIFNESLINTSSRRVFRIICLPMRSPSEVILTMLPLLYSTKLASSSFRSI